jgi:hypothetical protein
MRITAHKTKCTRVFADDEKKNFLFDKRKYYISVEKNWACIGLGIAVVELDRVL